MPGRAWLLAIAMVAVSPRSGSATRWEAATRRTTRSHRDCYAGMTVASCTVGNVTYGVSRWSPGPTPMVLGAEAERPRGMANVLAAVQDSKGVRFAGAMLPVSPDGLGHDRMGRLSSR